MGEIEMLGAEFGGGAALGGDDPGSGEGEKVGVSGTGGGVVVSGGEVEGEIDEGLAFG